MPGVDTRGHADRAGHRAIMRLDPIPDGLLVDRLGRLLHELAGAVSSPDALIDVAQLVGWGTGCGCSTAPS